MKSFIGWWIRGTSFGGNIKFYGSMIILAIVLISNTFSEGKNQASDNNGYTYHESYETCDEEPIYGYDTYGNYNIVGYEEECY
jgi:hypothetical protein